MLASIGTLNILSNRASRPVKPSLTEITLESFRRELPITTLSFHRQVCLPETSSAVSKLHVNVPAIKPICFHNPNFITSSCRKRDLIDYTLRLPSSFVISPFSSLRLTASMTQWLMLNLLLNNNLNSPNAYLCLTSGQNTNLTSNCPHRQFLFFSSTNFLETILRKQKMEQASEIPSTVLYWPYLQYESVHSTLTPIKPHKIRTINKHQLKDGYHIHKYANKLLRSINTIRAFFDDTRSKQHLPFDPHRVVLLMDRCLCRRSCRPQRMRTVGHF